MKISTLWIETYFGPYKLGACLECNVPPPRRKYPLYRDLTRLRKLRRQLRAQESRV